MQGHRRPPPIPVEQHIALSNTRAWRFLDLNQGITPYISKIHRQLANVGTFRGQIDGTPKLVVSAVWNFWDLLYMTTCLSQKWTTAPRSKFGWQSCKIFEVKGIVTYFNSHCPEKLRYALAFWLGGTKFDKYTLPKAIWYCGLPCTRNPLRLLQTTTCGCLEI